MPLDPALAWLLRSALAVLLLGAAAHKLRDFAAFRVALLDYGLVPVWLSGAAARLAIAAELAVGACLLSPWARPSGLAAAAGLLALYTLAIAVNLVRGRRDLDCGCFGPGLRVGIGLPLVARNGLWIAIALAGLILPPGARALGALDALGVAGALASLALLHQAAGHLLAARAPLPEAGGPR
jgi:hypothetical protein